MKTTTRQNIKNYLRMNAGVKNQEALALGLAEFLQDVHVANNFDKMGVARASELIDNTSLKGLENMKRLIELRIKEVSQ